MKFKVRDGIGFRIDGYQYYGIIRSINDKGTEAIVDVEHTDAYGTVTYTVSEVILNKAV